MAYNANIPQSTDQLNVSQVNLLENFQVLGAIAGNASPASGSINGTSGFNWIYLPHNASPPSGSNFPTGEIGLYSSDAGIYSQYELFLNRQIAGPTTVQIPIAASFLGSTANPGTGALGWSYIPSGIIIQWGPIAGGFPSIVTFDKTFPNACFFAFAYQIGTSAATIFYETGNLSKTGCKFYASSGASSAGYYFALGW